MNTTFVNNVQHIPMIQDQHISIWPKILIAQHVQLKSEIANISELLSGTSFVLFELDAKLRRLIKGVKIHLQLEHTFFIPTLAQINVSSNQKQRLCEGYDSLFETCESTASLIHSWKFALKNTPLSDEHFKQIKQMVTDISARLADEDIVYSIIDNSGEDHV